MTFEEYQKESRKTAQYPVIGYPYIYPALGLGGESGEVIEKVKKVARNDAGVMSDAKRAEIEKELGDVLWYLAQLATELNLSLDTVAENNIKKLTIRMHRGVIHSEGDDR